MSPCFSLQVRELYDSLVKLDAAVPLPECPALSAGESGAAAEGGETEAAAASGHGLAWPEPLCALLYEAALDGVTAQGTRRGTEALDALRRWLKVTPSIPPTLTLSLRTSGFSARDGRRAAADVARICSSCAKHIQVACHAYANGAPHISR